MGSEASFARDGKILRIAIQAPDSRVATLPLLGETERELFTVLLGRCRVHDALGGFEEVGPGEGLYIPPGFAGEFEVLEALTKTYMIAE